MSPPAPVPAAVSAAVAAPFDWTAWDGSDQGLPESLREHAAGIQAWHTGRYAPLESDLAEARQQIESLTATLGQDDPRIAEFTALREQHAVLQARYEALDAAQAAYATQQAQAEVDALFNANPQIFSDTADPIQAAHFAALVDETDGSGEPLWTDLGGIVDLVKAGPSAINAARQLRQRGTPADVAIELAVGKLAVGKGAGGLGGGKAAGGAGGGKAVAAGGSSADLIAGSRNGAGAPNITARVLPPGAAQHEHLRQIAADALHPSRGAR